MSSLPLTRLTYLDLQNNEIIKIEGQSFDTIPSLQTLLLGGKVYTFQWSLKVLIHKISNCNKRYLNINFQETNLSVLVSSKDFKTGSKIPQHYLTSNQERVLNVKRHCLHLMHVLI